MAWQPEGLSQHSVYSITDSLSMFFNIMCVSIATCMYVKLEKNRLMYTWGYIFSYKLRNIWTADQELDEVHAYWLVPSVCMSVLNICTHNFQVKFRSACGLKVGEIVHTGSLATGTALPGRFNASLIVYSSGQFLSAILFCVSWTQPVQVY